MPGRASLSAVSLGGDRVVKRGKHINQRTRIRLAFHTTVCALEIPLDYLIIISLSFTLSSYQVKSMTGSKYSQ